MSTLTLPRWFARTPSAAPGPHPSRAKLRIGIPRVLNLWSTHQFWHGLLHRARHRSAPPGVLVRHLGGAGARVRQGPRDGGLLLPGQVHLRPLRRAGLRAAGEDRHHLLADDLQPAVVPERPRGPEPHLPARHGRAREHQGRLPQGAGRLRRARDPLRRAVRVARRAEARPQAALRGAARRAARADAGRDGGGGGRRVPGAPGVLGRPPPAVARGARVVRARGPVGHPGAGPPRTTWIPGSATRSRSTSRPTAIPILWGQYLPLDADLLDWAFGPDVAAGHIRSPLDIRDVWPSSYSSNTNEILWGAKFAARMPWISCVVRLSSYECGMDQPTYTPVQQIVERSGTLFFSFQDLDSTKPAGSLRSGWRRSLTTSPPTRRPSSRRRRRPCRRPARSSLPWPRSPPVPRGRAALSRALRWWLVLARLHVSLLPRLHGRDRRRIPELRAIDTEVIQVACPRLPWAAVG